MFRFGERQAFELSAQVFNLFNWDNYRVRRVHPDPARREPQLRQARPRGPQAPPPVRCLVSVLGMPRVTGRHEAPRHVRRARRVASWRPARRWRRLVAPGSRPAAAEPPAAPRAAARPLRRHPGPDLPVLLGAGGPEERPRARPLPEPVAFEHRRRGLRPHRLSDRRRARLRHPRRGRGPGPRRPALLRRAPQGPKPEGRTGLQGLLLSLPRHADRRSLGPGGRALHHRHDPAPAGVLFCQSYFDGPAPTSGDPRAGRAHLLARRLGVGGAAAAHRHPWDGGPRWATYDADGASTTSR